MGVRFYLPAASAEDWRFGLADPHLHWKPGRSAHSLAHAWQTAAGFPPAVAAALHTDPAVAEAFPLLGLPEHKVPLPGGNRASQTDLFVLCSGPRGLIAIAIEGKAGETLGPLVADWREAASPGKEERLKFLLELLHLDDGSCDPLRYQLVHRTASAIIEAKRFGAQDAVMMVHSFGSQEGYGDYETFASALGVGAMPDTVAAVPGHSEPELHVGWVNDEVPSGAIR